MGHSSLNLNFVFLDLLLDILGGFAFDGAAEVPHGLAEFLVARCTQGDLRPDLEGRIPDLIHLSFGEDFGATGLELHGRSTPAGYAFATDQATRDP